MVDKVRPIASVGWSEGMDGKDAHETIELSCPKCKKLFAIVGTRYKDIRTAYNLAECCKECGQHLIGQKHLELKQLLLLSGNN